MDKAFVDREGQRNTRRPLSGEELLGVVGDGDNRHKVLKYLILLVGNNWDLHLRVTQRIIKDRLQIRFQLIFQLKKAILLTG